MSEARNGNPFGYLEDPLVQGATVSQSGAGTVPPHGSVVAAQTWFDTLGFPRGPSAHQVPGTQPKQLRVRVARCQRGFP